MLPICVKLTHALVDVISSLGYLKPLIFCMQLCQMLVQAMWIDDYALMQILDKPTALILAEQYDIKDVSGFT
jgi:preprotein translocase subunit Sec63